MGMVKGLVISQRPIRDILEYCIAMTHTTVRQILALSNKASDIRHLAWSV